MRSLLWFLFSQTVESGTCWEWTGPTNRGGYGLFAGVLVHRLVFALLHGDPGRLNVCHVCDNPPCINPSHLWEGTQAENVADMIYKQRAIWQQPLGRWDE